MNVYLQDLEDTLCGYGISAKVPEECGCSFRQIQWRRSGEEMAPETLYVEPMERGRGTVLLLRQETLLLPGSVPEEIYEAAFETLNRYNDWEAALINTVLQGGDAKTFLCLAGEQFGCPLVLADTNQDLLATSAALTADLSQIKVFLQVRASLEPLHQELSDMVTDFVDSLPETQTHILCAALSHGQHRLGSLYLYHFKGAVHKGVVYRVQEVARLLSGLLTVNADQFFSNSYISSVLPDVVHGKYNQWRRLRTELRAVGWQSAHTLRMAAVGNSSDPEVLAELREEILRTDPLCFAFPEETVLLVLGNETLDPSFVQKLGGVVRRGELELRVGCSVSFSRPQGLPDYYQQACFALRQAHSRDSLLEYASSWAIPAMREVLTQNEVMRGWAHPDLYQLQSYDLAAGSLLYETLRLHLLNGCRYDCTAKLLGVHPNTVRYRLQQAEKLLTGSLYDPEYRESLLMSFLVVQPIEEL